MLQREFSRESSNQKFPWRAGISNVRECPSNQNQTWLGSISWRERALAIKNTPDWQDLIEESACPRNQIYISLTGKLFLMRASGLAIKNTPDCKCEGTQLSKEGMSGRVFQAYTLLQKVLFWPSGGKSCLSSFFGNWWKGKHGLEVTFIVLQTWSAMGNPTENARQGLSSSNLGQKCVLSIRWKGKHVLEVTFFDFQNLICDAQRKHLAAHGRLANTHLSLTVFCCNSHYCSFCK